ncbi:MAG: DUF5069 domain-containing protein [Candidatus Sericytochromatia bacterium]|nr:DUF5069 domain-containing protein [Candidatus Tanganyikabacteria bacterium]
MQAKDLSREFPRSPFESIQGIPWLPRLIDKVRAKQAGTLGDYTPFPCGADKRFIATFHVDGGALEQVIFGGASDEEVAAWCLANAGRTPVEAAAEYRRTQFEPIAPERREYLEEYKREILASRPDLDRSALTRADNFATAICIEEGYPIPEPAEPTPGLAP